MNEDVIVAFIIFPLIILVIYGLYLYRKSKIKKQNFIPIEEIKSILDIDVTFFHNLNVIDQDVFAERVQRFIQKVYIHGLRGAKVDNETKVLVGASAIIPIFHFKEWRYNNIDEVLIYPDAFNKHYDISGQKRNIIGMVGEGAMNRMMILSQKALFDGFKNKSAQNTGIHEFVHLIDKSDGSVDGIPEALIHKSLVEPWLQAIYETTQNIENNASIIRKYAASNKAEFLAVTSEYFFQKPDLLAVEEPELFHLLNKIYQIPEHNSNNNHIKESLSN